jgi:hypothetical protein
MSDTELFHSRLPTPDEAEAVEYRAISALAVVGLLCGLAAATAILSPALWIVPLTGVLLNVLALGKIARETPALIGRKAALAGLLLSVFFGAVAMADWYTYSEMIRREARRFATLWFDSLRDHEPQKAHQLTRSPKTRRPFDDKLWEIYFDGSEPREDLKAYLERPEVRTLLALGDKAQVRYYASPSQSQEGGSDSISLVYAITYPEARQTKTFFLNLVLEREHVLEHDHLNSPPHAEWRVVSSEGGVGPDGKARDR